MIVLNFVLQVRGVAMGTKKAPNFANIFMAGLEEKHVFNYHTQPLYCRRYIDDIILFFIWDATDGALQLFQEHLNQAHPTIKFTFESSTTHVSYLDVTIFRIVLLCGSNLPIWWSKTQPHSWLLAWEISGLLMEMSITSHGRVPPPSLQREHW